MRLPQEVLYCGRSRIYRRRSQVVRQRSAKPPFVGSIPTGASVSHKNLGAPVADHSGPAVKGHGVSRYSVNQLVIDRRTVTAELAVRLARATNTTPEFWLNLQMAADLSTARHALKDQPPRIQPIRAVVDEADLFHDLE